MFVDVSGPDEFFTHQTNAIARQVGIFFCQFGVTEVHINFGAGGREVFSNNSALLSSLFFFRFFEDTFIYYTVSSVDGYINAVRNSGGSSFATALSTYDAGNTQFAGNDGSMAGHTAAISNDSFRFFHCRYPVGSGHFSYKDFAFFEFVNAGRIQNNVYSTRNLTRGSRQAFYDNFAISGHSFFLLFRCTIFFITTAPYGFRTSLENPQFTIAFIYAPFHIHVAAIVFFDFSSITSQFDDLFIGQLLFVLFVKGYHLFFAVAASFANQFYILTVNVFLKDFVSFFANGVVVRSYSALNNIFAQAPSSFHQNVLVIASCNVNGEHNACSFGEYHHLNCCTQSNV